MKLNLHLRTSHAVSFAELTALTAQVTAAYPGSEVFLDAEIRVPNGNGRPAEASAELVADPMRAVTAEDVDLLKQAGAVFGAARIPAGAVFDAGGGYQVVLDDAGNVHGFPHGVPSPAAAPASTSAPTADAGTSVALDARGLPWDERIHSGGRAIVKDGTWRAKRGVPEALVNQVEAELRREYPAPAAAAAAAAASVPEPPAPPASVPEPPAPPAPPAGVPEPPAPGQIPAAPLTFARLISLAQGAKARGVWTQEQLVSAVETLGLKTIGELATKPEMFAAFYQLIPE
jgi:hypothetical protein